MSIKLMTAVWDTDIGPATRRLVLLALADIANDEGEGWPSIDTLATRANCSRTAAENSLRSLVADGIIERESRGFHRSNLYRINPASLTPRIRGSESKTPKSRGDDPQIRRVETPRFAGTEPSVEPPEEPLKPSSDADASTVIVTDLFGGSAAGVQAGVQPPVNGHVRNGVSLGAAAPSEGDSRVTTRGSTPKVPPGDPENLFEEFWTTYAHKVAKGAARAKWAAACRKADPREIINAAARYAKGRDPQFVAHASTWLHGERWLDEPAYVRNGQSAGGDRRGGHVPYQNPPESAYVRSKPRHVQPAVDESAYHRNGRGS